MAVVVQFVLAIVCASSIPISVQLFLCGLFLCVLSRRQTPVQLSDHGPAGPVN